MVVPYHRDVIRRLSAVLALGLLAPFLLVPPTGATATAATGAGAQTWRGEPNAAALAHWGADRPGPAEQFYFVLPDRFANGDPGNDRGGLSGDRLSTGYDPTDKGFYHGGDLQGVIDRLDYIKGLGTTALWLAPVFENRPVQGAGAAASAGYHGYWVTDFTRVDPHFGTNADLKRLVDLAHRRGMKVYLDIIVNHTADVIQNEGGKSTYIDKATAPYRDSQGRPFEDQNYADGTRRFPDVNVKSFPYTPVFADPADAKVKVPAWLNDPTMYHNRGNSLFNGENSEYGDHTGLDDLWTERPEVVRGLTKIYADWIKETGIDGYRLDTVKHSNIEFWKQFSPSIAKAAARAGKPDFFMFGEVFSSDPEVESRYVREGGLAASLDFSFQQAARTYVSGDTPARTLADLYGQDDLYTARDTGAARMPTFLGNHDVGRIGSFIIGGGSDPAGHLRRAQLSHELMFLTRGQPVIYSGDEQGFTGPGGDKDARQDMFASRSADYLDDDLIGTDRTHASDQYDKRHPIYRTIAQLGALREAHPALRDGVQVTRYAADGAGVFAFSRIDPAKRHEYVVAVNNATTPQTVTVDTWSPGATFTGLYGGAGATVSGADGKLTVTVPALSAVVHRARTPIAVPSAGPTVRITAPAAGTAVPSRTELVAGVTGDPLATVTVAAQVNSGPWTLVGTARQAPYRVFHDLTGLAGGATVKYKAVARDSRGRTAATTSTVTVGTPSTVTAPERMVVHYQRPAGDYGDWRLYAFGDIDPSAQTTYPDGQPFAGQDSYGAFAWVKLKPGAKNVGFVVVDKAGVKDVQQDRFVDPGKQPEVWLKSGDAAVHPSRQAATGQPDPAQDPATAILHYRRADGDYTGWGLHVWDGAAQQTDWSAPLAPVERDAYGVTFKVPLAPGATGLSYVLHSGDTKDLPTDQRFDFAAGREAWLLAGVPEHLLPVAGKAETGGEIDLTKSRAGWVDRDTLAWRAGTGDTLQPVGGGTDGRVYGLAYAPAGGITVADGELTGTYRTLRLTVQRNGLTDRQRARFPDLWRYGAFRVAESDRRRLPEALRGQVVVTERDASGKLLSATGVRSAGEIDRG
ncbi:alpha-amylase family glycosyl hydrolase [Actinoplanes sp. NEAU-A12]|uniref:alpha-amylase n=1 Tax=Actinoplanes sandaracinus TaxID=3045177 RepID=A0ABT6WGU4_9ACTN|nr:alpha-amylase family glycosyl hydrolase [Actinoplanes sandaracinus]MDI6098941.1 alpha-amylase family glycosyl hydrolase [Actinoplanes sandaracinus]